MANVTISEIPGGEDTSPANTSEIEIKVGGVSKFAQLVNILKNAIPIGGTTPAPGAFTTLKQTTGKAAGAIPISDADGALTLTASTGSDAPVRATSPTITTPTINVGSDADGDTYHRASGVLARLAKGGADLKYFMNAGNTAPEWASGISIGTLTRVTDAVGADVAYTGVGFKPSTLITSFVWAGNCRGSGFDDGMDHYVDLTYGATPTYVQSAWAVCIFLINAAGGAGQNAIVKSFDSDGFTLTWVKAGAPANGTGYVYYMALR